ncbi:hypothetical protein EZH22_01400 [Xanthobacter dioxanivorans]|uniref:Uncharacterized protein n=1 Tax=Xanthobacter dioxanivorans TaxID=2528964 RepID=A0A974SK46_9HYPH|nr:hypothetical protein [Xanthobacter dioxanivorans]QRG07133.1 hypothetical protein EZH22_01400 [Xanthobacter dioxanivorans]
MVKARGARRSRLSTSAAVLAAALAGDLSASSARAQTDPAKFRAFLASDLYKAAFAVARDAIPPAVLPPCPDLSSPDSTVTIAKDVTFAKNGQPRSGAWWSRSPVSGCGIDTVINIFFSVGERGRIIPVVALPGTTHADLVLQRDALLYAFTGVKLRMESCPDLTVTNTRFEAYGLHGSPRANRRPRPRRAAPGGKPGPSAAAAAPSPCRWNSSPTPRAPPSTRARR